MVLIVINGTSAHNINIFISVFSFLLKSSKKFSIAIIAPPVPFEIGCIQTLIIMLMNLYFVLLMGTIYFLFISVDNIMSLFCSDKTSIISMFKKFACLKR